MAVVHFADTAESTDPVVVAASLEVYLVRPARASLLKVLRFVVDRADSTLFVSQLLLDPVR